MGNWLSQTYPGEAPRLTEQTLPNQAGKARDRIASENFRAKNELVFIVTGASSGVGKELVQILYAHDAKVYVAARSKEKAVQVIDEIKAAFPAAKGELVYMHLELEDLTTIKESAEDFLRKESRLDVLWNNAAVMNAPPGTKTKQGYELQLGTNNIGHFLFTKLLTPVLVETAKTAPKGSVRVVWVSSSAAEMIAPVGGVDMSNLDYKKDLSGWMKYGVSKAGNILHSNEYAKRHEADGLISVSLNPGNLRTNLNRHTATYLKTIFNFLFVYPPIFGAYTELFGGLSLEVANADWVVPWGRVFPLREDLRAAAKTEAEGGTGQGLAFWEWCEVQVKPFM